MNGPNHESAPRTGNLPSRPNGTQVPATPAKDDPAKLASVIEENRVKINKGWVELDKLAQLLNRMDRLMALRAKSTELRSAQTTPAPAENHAALVTEAA